MNLFTGLWIFWALFFVVVESVAVAGKRQPLDTLSRNIQWVVRTKRATWWKITTAVGWGIFAVWFGWHIWIR